jgi:hypothetical protein
MDAADTNVAHFGEGDLGRALAHLPLVQTYT